MSTYRCCSTTSATRSWRTDMAFWVATHHHSHGTDTAIIECEAEPSVKDGEACFDDVDAGADEWVEIHGPMEVHHVDPSPTKVPVEFLIAFEDKTWDTVIIEVPELVARDQSHDEVLDWVMSKGPYAEVQYRKVVLWSIYNFEPEVFDGR